jgi:hypothetical protein
MKLSRCREVTGLRLTIAFGIFAICRDASATHTLDTCSTSTSECVEGDNSAAGGTGVYGTTAGGTGVYGT